MNKSIKTVLMTISILAVIGGASVMAGDIYSTTANLNMRTGPSTGYSRILTIPKAKKVESLAKAPSGWLQVRYGSKVGYVSSSYVKFVSKDVAANVVSAIPNTGASYTCTTTANVNMRSGPTTGYKVLITVPKGKAVSYISTDKSGWYKVSYSGKTGYISNKYSKLTITGVVAAIPAPAPAPAPTPAPAPVVTPTPSVNAVIQQTLYFTTANLTMRTGSSTKYASLLSIPKGTHLISLGTSGGWHKVSYNGKTGWVSGTYLGSGTVFTVNGIIIANKGYGMSPSFAPGINPQANAALTQMKNAAARAGYTLNPFSSFRTYAYQAGLYSRYAANDGTAAADKYSARAGYSEHETGLAFDIGVGGMITSTNIGNHPGGIWMAQNAHNYGFILRYPAGKESITGYQYEPWHFRFVGVYTATKVYQSGLTLDEYLNVVHPNY